MEVSVLSLIETTRPSRLIFNDCNVLLNGFVYKSDKRMIKIETACRNGLWAIAHDLSCTSCGCGSPICRNRDFVFPTFAEAIKHDWQLIKSWFERNDCVNKKEMQLMQKEYQKFLSKTPEEYFNLFTEQDFYCFL